MEPTAPNDQNYTEEQRLVVDRYLRERAVLAGRLGFSHPLFFAEQSELSFLHQREQRHILQRLLQNQLQLQSVNSFERSLTPTRPTSFLFPINNWTSRQILDQLRTDTLSAPRAYRETAAIYPHRDQQLPWDQLQSTAQSRPQHDTDLLQIDARLSNRRNDHVAQSFSLHDSVARREKVPTKLSLEYNDSNNRQEELHPEQLLLHSEQPRERKSNETEVQNHTIFVNGKEKHSCFPLPPLKGRETCPAGGETISPSRKNVICSRSMANFRKKWRTLHDRAKASKFIRDVDSFAAELFRRSLSLDSKRATNPLNRKIQRLPSSDILFPRASPNEFSFVGTTHKTQKKTKKLNKDGAAFKVKEESSSGEKRKISGIKKGKKGNDKKKRRT